jgi:predicted signal transduction protein with EAL and GGDEF domain
MSQSESSVEQCQKEIASLRQEIEGLNAEKADLQLLLEIITEHSDFVENELWENASFAETILKTSTQQFSAPITEEQSEPPSPEPLPSEHEKLQKDLTRESLKDPLTKLYRRHYMEESLIRELTRCRRHNFPLTVLMVGIDHFQSVEATLGSKVADIALQEMGYILSTSIRREDIACRYNGEKFTLVLPRQLLTISNDGPRRSGLK